MSKKTTKRASTRSATPVPGFRLVASAGDISEYILTRNGFRVLYRQLPGTGVVSSNLTYLVGSRHEARGKTGLAHMLEHMLFKPTEGDLAAGLRASADRFEAETGCQFNANTSRDRTTYYFSYPKDHLARALSIEADRMQHVFINEENFSPERNNVLSEFDMIFSQPEIALNMRMSGCAFHSHPYGHEVIGFRDDIEQYTADDLIAFYQTYYRPDNAVLTVVGDIELTEVLREVKRHFGKLTNPSLPVPTITINEEPIDGQRTATIKRKSSQNILAIGCFHDGFPSSSWYTTMIALSALAEGSESILYRELVDSGVATSVYPMIEPSRDRNLAIVYITLAPGNDHDAVLTRALTRIHSIEKSELTPLVRKLVAGAVTREAFTNASSLQTALALTEYVAAEEWQAFVNATELLSGITSSAVAHDINDRFSEDKLVIGRFIGTRPANA